MKKIFFAFSLVLISSLSVIAQKAINDPNAERRSAKGYHGVEVSGGIDLFLSQGEEAVAVSASESKYRENIKVEVKDGILKIWYDSKSMLNVDWNSNRKLKAYVSYKTLDQLGASGGSDVSVDGSIKTAKLSMNISGGSDFNGSVEVNDLSLDATGGSDATISGSARNLDIEASGGSDVKGFSLSADICNLEASGGSDISITVNKELSANASGGSDISYKGNATIKEMKSSGSSSVRKTGK